jgi:phosphoribosylanthranilate isomerase
VDAIGLIVTAQSKRCVDAAQAVRLRAQVPSFVSVVLLVMDPAPDELRQWLALLHPDLLQFHGSETAQFCDAMRWPYLKALAGGGQIDLLSSAREFSAARGLVLDAHEPGAAGGTGHVFDWNLIPSQLRGSCILSGGLDATRVTRAIQQITPYALDVASGIESAPGIKSVQRMQEFLAAVHAADQLETESP